MTERGRGAALPEAVEQVLRELEPVAVLLHGSRAVARDRSDSDWDICVLVDSAAEPRCLSQLVGDVWLDLDVLPVGAEDTVMTEVFGTSLRSARVLRDSPDHIGAAFVARAREIHEQGRRLPTSTLVEQAAHAERVAKRMAASTGQADLFFFHLSTCFGLAVRYWFDRVGRWPEAPDEALESIAAADPDYASLLSKLSSDACAEAKARAAEAIVGRLRVDT